MPTARPDGVDASRMETWSTGISAEIQYNSQSSTHIISFTSIVFLASAGGQQSCFFTKGFGRCLSGGVGKRTRVDVLKRYEIREATYSYLHEPEEGGTGWSPPDWD